MKTNQLFIFSLFIFSFSLFAQNELPINANNSTIKPLGTLFNKDLQKGLEFNSTK